MGNYSKANISIQDLKEKISPEEYYISQLGNPARRAGNNLTFLCPFHPDGKNPNLCIGINGKHEGRFKCFSCGVSGDFIEFHQKYHNLSFQETLNDLARIYAPELLDRHKTISRSASKYGFTKESHFPGLKKGFAKKSRFPGIKEGGS